MHVLNLILGMVLGQRVPPVPSDPDQQATLLASPLSSHINMYLTNNSGSIGYLAVQGSKGRIIVVDNELTESMIINRKYAIAHTSNINLRRLGQSDSLFTQNN